MEMKRFVVSLVGRRLPENENLGVACLVAALRAAGFEARFHGLNGPGDMKRVAAEIGTWKPGIVGFSMPDGGSAYLPLAAGTMLRQRGYEGHITCGGPFATLAREWLLDRYEWIDSVVRFAGEIPIVELARKIRSGAEWSGVPGVTTRAGDGTPAAVLDDAPLRIWPERGDLPEVAGHPMANVVASRGCRGRCAYCGPAALQELEVREGLAGGASRHNLACLGVGGVRQRDVEDLSDEMAWLWHDKGVRYFALVDEHPLPWNEEAAMEYLAKWKRGLKKRGVGVLGIGTMMRADRITSRIARTFVDVGLARAFIGFEMVGRKESRLYGRPPMADQAAGIIDLLESMGVATVSNVMLVHPYSTPETIRMGIDFMASMRRGVFETTRMQVYHGTRLHRTMLEKGRLRGNPLRYNYTFADSRIQGFDEILTRLRMEAFEDHSVAYSTHDMCLGLALRERLDGTTPARVRERCEWICLRLRDLQVKALGSALDLAMRGAGFSGCSDLVRDIRDEAARLREEIGDISARIHRPSGRRPAFSHVRAAATTALRVLMMGAPLASCYSSQQKTQDAAVEVVEEMETVEEVTGEPRECTQEEIEGLRSRVQQGALAAEPCFSGYVDLRSGEVLVYANAWSSPEYCTTAENEAMLEERADRVRSALEGLDLVPDCTMYPAYLEIGVTGQDSADEMRLHEAVREECPDIPDDCGGFLVGTVITVDMEGRVVDVVVQDGCDLPADALTCIKTALEGLTFPCLAGLQICPEPVLLD